jgi:hypothetical protein
MLGLPGLGLSGASGPGLELKGPFATCLIFKHDFLKLYQLITLYQSAAEIASRPGTNSNDLLIQGLNASVNCPDLPSLISGSRQGQN